jgi:hypothetical protein
MRLFTLLALLCFALPAVAQTKRDVLFWSAASALAASAVLDYQSGLQAQSFGAVETNHLGDKIGAFGSAVVCGAIGSYLHKRGGKWAWLGSALMAGASVPHFRAARHNFAIR